MTVYVTNLTSILLENWVYAALNCSVVSSKVAAEFSLARLTKLPQELRGHSFGILLQTNLHVYRYTFFSIEMLKRKNWY